jgi:hypothetical protein
VQKIEKLKVYPGADGEFSLYRDDGNTYDYEMGKMELTKLQWSDSTGKLTHSGSPIGPVVETDMTKLVEVVGKGN